MARNTTNVDNIEENVPLEYFEEAKPREKKTLAAIITEDAVPTGTRWGDGGYRHRPADVHRILTEAINAAAPNSKLLREEIDRDRTTYSAGVTGCEGYSAEYSIRGYIPEDDVDEAETAVRSTISDRDRLTMCGYETRSIDQIRSETIELANEYYPTNAITGEELVSAVEIGYTPDAESLGLSQHSGRDLTDKEKEMMANLRWLLQKGCHGTLTNDERWVHFTVRVKIKASKPYYA
ncbi:hypothetical protein [Halorubrum sp. SD626R]|uniref:hypothetical protein n=1 Tax=Halorubrum sp. SD626R TaxID=1419722 RepID=UPI000A49AA0A|nr:hypothetical protein [Halorubrum sp. SD626R]TKX79911.1 hypothetical protein EXE53_13490 [Halorubrum sp. SD626R]